MLINFGLLSILLNRTDAGMLLGIGLKHNMYYLTKNWSVVETPGYSNKVLDLARHTDLRSNFLIYCFSHRWRRTEEVIRLQSTALTQNSMSRFLKQILSSDTKSLHEFQQFHEIIGARWVISVMASTSHGPHQSLHGYVITSIIKRGMKLSILKL